MQTSSEKGTPKHAKPKNKDIRPFDYTPAPNPEAAKQLHFPHNTEFRTLTKLLSHAKTKMFLKNSKRTNCKSLTFGKIDGDVTVVRDLAGANL